MIAAVSFSYRSPQKGNFHFQMTTALADNNLPLQGVNISTVWVPIMVGLNESPNLKNDRFVVHSNDIFSFSPVETI